MAHFVPVLSSVVGKMTSGERRFARRLESHLEDDYICLAGRCGRPARWSRQGSTRIG